MANWLKITPDGTITEVKISSLQDMYREIGCDMVERVSTEGGTEIWLDEMGKISGRRVPINPLATFVGVLGRAIPDNDAIFGTVLIGQSDDAEGDIEDLSAGKAAAVRAIRQHMETKPCPWLTHLYNAVASGATYLAAQRDSIPGKQTKI
jgi:hypothetical protein